MTALSENLLLTLIRDVFPLFILTYLHFSQVGKPILDSILQVRRGLWETGLSGLSYGAKWLEEECGACGWDEHCMGMLVQESIHVHSNWWQYVEESGLMMNSIRHCFSTELLSTSNSALISIFKHQLPLLHGFPSFTLWSSLNSLHHTAIAQHVQARWPQIHSQGPLWHWNGRPLQA